MSKRPCPKELSYDDIKNSLERHTSYEAGKQMLVVLMSAGEVAVTSAKLSLKCKVRLTLCQRVQNKARLPCRLSAVLAPK